MNLTRKKIIIILLAVFLVLPLIGFGIFLLTSPKEDPTEAYLKTAVSITTDKDTGALIEDDPNKLPEENEAQETTILGLESLINQGIVTAQITFIKDSLNTYAKEKLNNQFTTLTIRPQDLTNSNGVFTSTLRLGQTDEIVPITITATDTGESRVVVSDPNNSHSGTFDTGPTYFSAD